MDNMTAKQVRIAFLHAATLQPYAAALDERTREAWAKATTAQTIAACIEVERALAMDTRNVGRVLARVARKMTATITSARAGKWTEARRHAALCVQYARSARTRCERALSELALLETSLGYTTPPTMTLHERLVRIVGGAR